MQVLAAVDDCISKNVRAICVISAGFSECDADGRAREAMLRRQGPPGRLPPDRAQLHGPAQHRSRGSVERDVLAGVSAAREASRCRRRAARSGWRFSITRRRLDIGISSFVSVGNKADVSGNDLIQYWAEDPNTSVILLYLESFGNPKKFSEIARRVGRTKPIVAVKAGRSSAGSRAAASHTGALATNDVVVDALFRQAGVIRTERLEEMFDVAALLVASAGPARRARRDPDQRRRARHSRGRRLRGQRPAAAAAERRHAIRAALVPAGRRQRQQSRGHAGVGAGGTLPPGACVDPARRSRRQRHHDLHSAARDRAERGCRRDRGRATDVTANRCSGVFMRAGGAPAALAPIPSYAFPESAALALARVTAYGQWRSKPIVPAPALDRFDRDEIRRIVQRALRRGGGWALPDEAQALLDGCRHRELPSHESSTASTRPCGRRRSSAFPVALKALGRRCCTRPSAERSALNLARRCRRCGPPMRISRPLRSRDDRRPRPADGAAGRGDDRGSAAGSAVRPVIACGTGGVLVDVLADTAFRLHPLMRPTPREMIDELKGSRLLRGYRARRRLTNRRCATSCFACQSWSRVAPEIQELDLNPVIVLWPALGSQMFDYGSKRHAGQARAPRRVS